MWNDPHISKQLLQVHLNQEVDLASRKEASIDKTIAWILDRCNSEKLNILDLGCGPGLYCEKLHDQGHIVTGVDISGSSIEYARSKALKGSKSIEYLNSDYLNMDLPSNQYHLVMMVYTDFGVLLPEERLTLLRKIYSSLKPGGRFVFDVLNDLELDAKVVPADWKIAEAGFWSDKPYMVLSNSFLYEQEKVILYQHNVVSDDEIRTFRFWTHHFSKSDMQSLISNTAFKLEGEESGVLPERDSWTGEHLSFYTLLK